MKYWKIFLIVAILMGIFGCKKEKPTKGDENGISVWTVYNIINSPLPSNIITALAIDGNNIWIGTWDGLAVYTGE